MHFDVYASESAGPIVSFGTLEAAKNAEAFSPLRTKAPNLI